MSVSDVYFQFPIGALRLGKSIEDVTDAEASDRFYSILNYCIIDYGIKNFDDTGREVVYRYKAEKTGRQADPTDSSVAVIYFGASKLDICIHAEDSKTAKCRHQQHQKISALIVVGGNQMVRLRRDLFWDLPAMGWRDWSILCAVSAAIGSNAFQKVSYERLNALALGYTTRKHLKPGEFEALKLTDRKIGTTIKRLTGRSIFSKASPNGRHNYYSWKPLKELAELLMQNELRRQEKKRISDSSVTQMIRDRVELELRRSRGSNPPKASGDESERHAKSREMLVRGLNGVGKVSE